MSEDLKRCHSQVAPSVKFNKALPECIACPQHASCEIATQRRVQEAQRRANPAYAPQGVYNPSPRANTQNGYNVAQHQLSNNSVLAFDPTPEQDESVWTRMGWNMLGAALASGTQEVSNTFRRTKLGARVGEHNRRARVYADIMQRELSEMERQNALHAKTQEQLAETEKRLRDLEQKLKLTGGGNDSGRS